LTRVGGQQVVVAVDAGLTEAVAESLSGWWEPKLVVVELFGEGSGSQAEVLDVVAHRLPSRMALSCASAGEKWVCPSAAGLFSFLRRFLRPFATASTGSRRCSRPSTSIQGRGSL